jgi:hypothetical protein
MVTAWGDSHIWVMEWTLRHLLEGQPQALLQPTMDAGFPVARDLRSVGGAALLLYGPLRLLLSPLAAGTLTPLLVLPATSLLTYGALGALTRAPAWTRAACAPWPASESRRRSPPCQKASKLSCGPFRLADAHCRHDQVQDRHAGGFGCAGGLWTDIQGPCGCPVIAA